MNQSPSISTEHQPDAKNDLLRALWEAEDSYYEFAHETSLAFRGNRYLGKLAEITESMQPMRILDCGCGEGTKLSLLLDGKTIGFGVDISSLAVQKAKQNYEHLELAVADLETLPFACNRFDVVTSFYTLEHTSQPEMILDEMIRVLRPGGLLVIAAPNFGSPLFPSPCSTERYKTRFLRRMWLAYRRLLRAPHNLEWERVNPKVMIEGRYEMDWDATVEPYVYSLIQYLAWRRVECVYWSTDIADINLVKDSPSPSVELGSPGEVMKNLCLRAGQLGIPPYSYFGPNFYYAGIASKESI